MRYSAFGLQPSANHATSSSRVSIGVISTWSRAILVTSHFGHELRGTVVKGAGPYTGAAREGNGGAPHDINDDIDLVTSRRSGNRPPQQRNHRQRQRRE